MLLEKYFIFVLKSDMMSVRRNLFLALFFAVGSIAYGQSDIFLTQQWFSRINMNPAATGNSNNVNIFLLNRQQWVGFANAPRTTILNAHSYFNTIQSGLGLSLFYDKLGVSYQTVNAKASYAYHIDLTEEVILSMGLSGGLYNSFWDPKQNTFYQPDDPEASTEKLTRNSADVDAGLELNVYGFTLGGSVTHLLNSSPEKSYTGKPGREYYGYIRYRVAMNRNFDIAPGVMYRNASNSNFFDFNLTGYFYKKIWTGLSFRPNNAFSAMLGGEFRMFRIGYAYDRSIGPVSSLAANSHEVMLSVRIQKPQKGRKTTRFLD